MAQVFVGLQYGSNQTDQIGPSVWQMIWLSILSMLVTLPSSQFVAPFFFEGTAVREPANTYFSTMMAINFLFPLGTAISSYFIGQGRTGVIFLTTLIAHSVNIVLDYFFIFGIEGVLPPMGVFGAALATGIAPRSLLPDSFHPLPTQKRAKNFWNQSIQIRLGEFLGAAAHRPSPRDRPHHHLDRLGFNLPSHDSKGRRSPHGLIDRRNPHPFLHLYQ